MQGYFFASKNFVGGHRLSLLVVTGYVKQGDLLARPSRNNYVWKGSHTSYAFLSPYLIDEEIDCENSYSMAVRFQKGIALKHMGCIKYITKLFLQAYPQ